MPARKRQARDDMPATKPAAASAAAASAPSTPQMQRRPQRQQQLQQQQQQQQPLFAPYRALGVVTSPAAAPVHQRRGDTSFVTASAGRSWQVYECGRLTLRAIGPLVSCLAAVVFLCAFGAHSSLDCCRETSLWARKGKESEETNTRATKRFFNGTASRRRRPNAPLFTNPDLPLPSSLRPSETQKNPNQKQPPPAPALHLLPRRPR